MMLSETQERMLLVVEKGTEQKFLDLFEKHELDSAVIGEVILTASYLNMKMKYSRIYRFNHLQMKRRSMF